MVDIIIYAIIGLFLAATLAITLVLIVWAMTKIK